MDPRQLRVVSGREGTAGLSVLASSGREAAFQVNVTRLDDLWESFLIVQRYGELRVGDAVEKALRAKLRKLRDTNADRLLLMFERDQGWVFPNEIYEHVDHLRSQFAELAEIDEIWIADTATLFPDKSYLCFLNREGGATEESFQFKRGVLQAISQKGQVIYTASQGWWFDRNRPRPQTLPAVPALPE